jgi:hypothetical protein
MGFTEEGKFAFSHVLEFGVPILVGTEKHIGEKKKFYIFLIPY